MMHDAIVRLLLSRRAALLGYINSIMRDVNLAEDVFQEVSIVALRKGAAIQDEAHFGLWFRRAARLECLSIQRKRSREPILLGDALLDMLDEAWQATDADAGDDRLDALRACLQKLTTRSQQLLHLRYVEGRKGVDIAAHLQQPVNSIYVALSRIHRALGNCLHKWLRIKAAANE
jgi:RNA polymerase sigma-70 factor (ECF subfamily)